MLTEVGNWMKVSNNTSQSLKTEKLLFSTGFSFMKTTLILVSTLISFHVLAQTPVSSPELATPAPSPAPLAPPAEAVAPAPLKIKWYKPVYRMGAPEGKVRTILSGQTEAGSKIDLGATDISVILANGQIQSFKASDLKAGNEIAPADGNGYFEMVLDLPQGAVQLPIGVALQEKTNIYQVNLVVSPKSIEMKSATELEASPALEHRAYIWAGLGYNYVNMKQDIDSIRSHVAFESYRGPSTYLETMVPVSDNWDILASYKKSPGAVGSPEGFSVQSGNYSWDILMVEAQYSKPTWKTMISQKPAKFYLRFGLNQNTVPFWERTGLYTFDIKTNQVLMASVGGSVEYEYSDKWVLTSLFRFHQPVSTDSLGAVQSKFSFDGSVGAYYRFNNHWNIGGFWYGRYHNWDFQHTDAVLNQDVSGHQELLFSNMELRFGYGF
jgi:hypothetical protein